MDSAGLFAKAIKVIPGGVNSPVRAFKRVGGTPRFVEKAQGPYIFDVEGNRYIDHVLSWGPMILGHAHPAVVEAVRQQAGKGMSFGAPTELEVSMAETVCSAIPSIDMIRFVSSGTEATMSAIRLARAYTERELIVKFEGCYHGHVDSLLVKAGSGALTFAIPDTSGIPETVASTTAVLPYNETGCFKEFMKVHGQSVAAVIIEPVAGNMGMIQPRQGFLESVREQTRSNGALLIFDEVITGFRFCFGGYQDLVGIAPDMTCLGKIIGGGMPVGAFGGKADIMSMLSPAGPVYQAGTLSGNPVAMASGLATLKVLRDENPYERLTKYMDRLAFEIGDASKKAGVPVTFNHEGSMGGIFFHEGPVETFNDVMESDAGRYALFFNTMLKQGVYLAPSPYESLFISTVHDDEHLDHVINTAGKCLSTL